MATEEELRTVRSRMLGMIDESRIVTTTVSRPSADVIAGFLSVVDLCSTVSDALDELGVGGAIPASRLQPVVPGARVCGPAITLRYVPRGGSVSARYGRSERALLADRDLYGMGQAGDIAILSSGLEEVSVMGGLSTAWARRVGIAACITDGGVRDIESIRRLEHPVWSSGKTPITGRHRLEAAEINCTVTLAGVAVRPGDLVVADDTGVCIVPVEVIGQVLERCLEGDRTESVVISMLNEGRDVADIVSVLPLDKW